MSISDKQWLDRIRALPIHNKIRIMNVCGGHERSITMAGLRSALPELIEIIPGPGCPVCICPEEDIFEAMQLALHEDIILVAFGDMLRVPVNTPKNEPRSLEHAKAAGADIRPISSPIEVVHIAEQNPERTIVFFAAGFETTIAPVAAMMTQGVPDNLKLLISARLTWPAVAMLLDSGEAAFQCLIAPGHVSTVMGPEEWQFVVDKHRIPTAVAGFTSVSLLAAIYSVLRQHLEQNPFLDNCYPEVVHAGGNPLAKKILQETMDVVDARWRGVGIISRSGFELNSRFDNYNARKQLPNYSDNTRKRVGEMPPGCECTRVVLGKIYPNECGLYGHACIPHKPVGPCMVSDEGACRIWWAGGIRDNAQITEPA